MKTVKFIVVFTTIIIFSSCKKEYHCVCSNPGGTVAVFTVKNTKKKATNECKDYYNKNYASTPLNETSCSIK